LRTGLHAGPVFQLFEPVTESLNCIGVHVSRAARIEPITPKGQVFVSREFAALAETHPGLGFACDYVGQTDYDKNYGTFPTYHLHRK
jgi:class 3 adenylate cyclase